MKYNTNRQARCSCGGYFINGICIDCDSPAKEVNKKSNYNAGNYTKGITIGECYKCGDKGKEIDGEIICFSCRNVPTWGGQEKKIARRFGSREEAMYYKAKFVYHDNPIYLGLEANDRVVAIAYDRWMSKKFNRSINQNLWDELPIDVL